MYMPAESFADSVSSISKPIGFSEVAFSSISQFFGHSASIGHPYTQRSKWWNIPRTLLPSPTFKSGSVRKAKNGELTMVGQQIESATLLSNLILIRVLLGGILISPFTEKQMKG